MYSREQNQEARKLFWIAFGRFISQYVSVRGPKIKWINYKTGVKDIYFRLDLDNSSARVSIEMQHSDPGIRALFFEQWEQVRDFFEESTTDQWIWQPHFVNENGMEIARIYVELQHVSIYQQETWGEVFDFFREYLIPLDDVWNDMFDLFWDLSEG